ncbi:MAG: GIY-YIG nuclease family protein [Thermodesulfovibrionales bacterium]
MDKGFIYVLRCSDGRLYTGSPRDLAERLKDHNAGRVRTTKNRRPLEVIYTEEFSSYSDARIRELYLKSGTGRTWLRNHAEGWPSG